MGGATPPEDEAVEVGHDTGCWHVDFQAVR